MKTSLFFVLLLSPLFFAIGNVIDSYLVTKYGGGEEEHGNIAGLLVIGSFFSFFVSIAIFVFFSKELLLFNFASSLVLVLTGMFSVLTTFFYLKALKEDHTVAVIVWAQTIPFFTYVFSFIFLGETLSNTQIIGGLIVIIGSLIVGISEKENITWNSVFNKKVILLMFATSICYSIVAVLFKIQAVAKGSYWGSSFYENMGVFFVGVVIYLFYEKSKFTFHRFITVKEVPLLVINSFNELIFIGATLITQFVILEIPIAIGSAINGLTPAFVFILSLLLTKFFPGRIHDISLSWLNILKNSFGIILTLLGLVLLK